MGRKTQSARVGSHGGVCVFLSWRGYGVPWSSCFQCYYACWTGLESDQKPKYALCKGLEGKIFSKWRCSLGRTKERTILYMAKHCGWHSDFQRGHIWQVGTWVNNNIWDDRIPSSPTRKVITLHGHALLKTVDELINPNSWEWDVEITADIFNPVCVHCILQIPLNIDNAS